MKHLIVSGLIVLALISLTSCGRATDTGLTTNSSVISSKGNGQHFTLTATSNGGGIVTLSNSTEIAFPVAIQGLANASGHRRAILQIGSISCAYVADSSSAYIRNDGSCNTFYPNSPVSVKSGDTLTLYIESVDSNAFTSVQADLQGGIYE